MQFTEMKRLEIVVEQPIVTRICDLLEKKGAKEFTVTPALHGLGPEGPWSCEGQVGAAGKRVVVTCVLPEERMNALFDELFTLVKRHIGHVVVSDCAVVRPEVF